MKARRNQPQSPDVLNVEHATGVAQGNLELFDVTGEALLGADLRSLGQVGAPASVLPGVLAKLGLSSTFDVSGMASSVDAFWAVDSAIGRLYVTFGKRGVTGIVPAVDDQHFASAFVARFGRPAPVHQAAQLPAALRRQVARGIAGRNHLSNGLDLTGVTPFERAVLLKALEIPRGEIRSYAWVAREIGRPGAVRAVGTALGRNPVPLLIPCHRVVRSDHRVRDYVFGLEAKRTLLLAEGVDPDALERMADDGIRYWGSDTTHVFCFPTCRHARRITERHRVTFPSVEAATSAGYRACRDCRPAPLAAVA